MTVKRAREKYGRASSTRPRSRAQISRNEATVQIGGGSDDSGPVYDRARRAGPIRDGEGRAGREGVKCGNKASRVVRGEDGLMLFCTAHFRQRAQETGVLMGNLRS